MTSFDPIRTPLQGIRLIEAAAGTGKTYAIESLYLRLVLEKQMPVEQILVVTFTRAATAELRDRIYQRLAKARDVFAGACGASDEFLSQWMDRHPNRAGGNRLLRQALMDFDRAAIFTIHGFCQRLLYENVFETASAFDAELVQDHTPILLEVVEDFWRRSICSQPPEFLRFAQAGLGAPSDLARLVQTAVTAGFAVTPQVDAPCLRTETLQAVKERIEDLKTLWKAGRDDVQRMLLEAPLNAKSFGSLQTGNDGPSGRRAQIVQGLADALDGYLAQNAAPFPPVAAVAKLAASNLARATLSRRQPPMHAVFEACEALHQSGQALAEQMTGHLIYLKSHLLKVATVELERRKRRMGVLSFDDLLRQVARALDGRSGNELAGLVRQRFRAALVDEFQDTDDLQYAVFSRLFRTSEHVLVLIGDPKQAIYGFRGADIFSYLRAARDAEACLSLERNWRSTDGLVAAVNALFGRSPAPFLFEGIRFTPGRAVRGPEVAGAPMTIWRLDASRYRDDGKPLTKTEAQGLVARAVTTEIRRLIDDPASTVAAGDIAVLVRTNSQASLMKDQLCAAGVAAVVYSTADVFASTEAHELLSVLTAIAEPFNMGRLKSAMATQMLGVGAAEIVAADRDETGIEQRVRRHCDYLRIWSERGFAPMFRQFLRNERVKQRLIARPNGERRLTNLLHLAERLHAAAEEENLGPAGLVKWLGRQLDPQMARPEENQLRLESDALAVKIVTVHRSKGLEYPVVFCPFAWSGSALHGEDVFFHDPQAGYRFTADLSGDRHSFHRILAQNENLAENLRLLYVSLTRARDRCYLVWGRINTAETSALAYLLRPGGTGENASPHTDWTARLKAEYAALGDDELRERLEALAAAANGAIVIRPLPEAPAGRPPETGRPATALACREFRGRIAPAWSLTSFSALVSAAGGDGPDRDAGDMTAIRDAPAEGPQPTPAAGLFGFPAGAHAGTFFHSILEVLDFTDSDPRPLVRSKLKEFGFDLSWEDAVCAMIGDVLAVPLFGPGSRLQLRQIRRERMVAEMEFCFPLKRVTPEILENVFARHGGMPPSAERAFPETIGRLHFAPVHGYMKGFIDLVFEQHGRFYLIDWKSNRLGPAPEDYGRERLATAMAEHDYDLQYHLYALAFHQYLCRRVANYEYDRDFGGICYVFLRGIDRRRGPEFGLFHDRPAPSLMHALGETLIPDYA
jgi:exodeoxyribonuclease V beta subunit